MSGLALNLLGTPQVTQNGQVVEGFRSAKARALLFYVAVSGEPQSRAKLASLLWGELPEENANANLRKTLTNLRKLAGPHLAITRNAVAVAQASPPWLDVRAFEAALDGGDAEAAIDLYRGDFLDGFYVRQAPEFETWQLSERYRLRERMLSALQWLSEYEAGKGHFAAAIGYVQRLVALEPLREDAHRLLMSLFAQNGQRAAALAQYEVCARVLAEELEVEPGEKTTTLFNQIRDGTFRPPLAPARRHNLPAPTTSFVGREEELAHIKRWLADATDRLLTIVGPGGAGKTRLAYQVAWKVVDSFADGVWALSLASVEDVSSVANRVAAALGIAFFGKEVPEAQVVRYLRGKELLLLLDNAEHLLSQAFADFLMGILTRAPAVKIIVTSRERLALQSEQVLDLPGLAFPEQEAAIAASAYPAAQLFLQRAEGHGRSLPATPENDEALLRLCRLVEGLPLALELAAAWTPTKSLPDIVVAVERGLAFLTTQMRDIPQRHRSVEAVFDTSWGMLAPEERRVMRQLAYFRGGFSAESAATVAGATLSQLQALRNKSLIRGQDGRYDMHQLLRQYAAGKLAQRPGEAEAVARRHGRYFAAFLAEREAAMYGIEYLQAKAEIEDEVDDVRKAWEWAVAAGSLDDIARSVETLHYFFLNTQGLFREAAERFQRAATRIAAYVDDEREELVGRLLLKAGINRRMLGQLEEASRLVEESLSLFYRHESAADIVRATSTLSVIRKQQNEKAAAMRLAEMAVGEARELDLPVDLCLCLNNLAYVLAENGNYEAAAATAEESVALARGVGFPHGELSAMNMLGVYYQWLGEGDKAQRIFEELVVRCRQAATQSRLAQAVNNLGALYRVRGESDKALPLLQEAARLYEEVGQVHYAAFTGVMLGELGLEQGDEDQARRHCQEALRVAQDIEMPALALDAIMLLAQIVRAQGRDEEAVTMLALAAKHKATLSETRKRAQQALQSLRDAMTPQAFAAARDKGAAWTLEDVLQRSKL